VPNPAACPDATSARELDRELADVISACPGQVWLARPAGEGWVNAYAPGTWAEASAGRPYAVPLAVDGSFRTLALDFDVSKGDAARDAATVTRLLTEAEIKFARARSGPAGGQHVFATFTDEGLSEVLGYRLVDALGQVAPSLDRSPMTNVRTGLIRPPGSPHRRGGRSELLGDRADAVSRLRAGNPPAAALRLAQLLGVDASAPGPGSPGSTGPRRRRPLSPEVTRLLRQGDVDGRCASRSECAYRVALGMVNAGQALEDFVQAVTSPCSPGLEHCRTWPDGTARVPAQVLALCARLWKAAELYAMRSPARAGARDPEVSALVASVATAADEAPQYWSGLPGPTARAVLSAVLALIARSGKAEVSAGQRQLAEMAGVARPTAASAVKRLLRTGWLEVVQPSEGTLATTYRVRLPAAPQPSVPAVDGARQPESPGPMPTTARPAPPQLFDLDDTDLPLALHPQGVGVAPGVVVAEDPPMEGGVSFLIEQDVLLQSHDAFRRAGGLGGQAVQLLKVLARGALTAAELILATGADPRTVRKYLGLLADQQLVEVDGEGRWAACHTPERLDGAAASLGTAGLGGRQRVEHKLEQLLYRWYLSDVAASHGWSFQRGRWVEGWLYVKPVAPEVDGHAPAAVMAPLRRFPRSADGRHDWSAADRLVRGGGCPVLPGDPATRGVAPRRPGGRRGRAHQQPSRTRSRSAGTPAQSGRGEPWSRHQPTLWDVH
jgi:DNA-binding transcriptional ArsR family regulator